MLACRPMLPFAVALMGGILAARFVLALSAWLPLFWIVLALGTAWHLLARKRPAPPVPDMPDGYGPIILPARGMVAAHGLNRIVILVSAGFFLLGMYRQNAWHDGLHRVRLPDPAWFTATMRVRQPIHDHPEADGAWAVPAEVIAVDGEAVAAIPVRLSGPDGPPFRRGDLLFARVRVAPARPPAHPGAFDFRFWLERDALVTSLFVVRSRFASPDSPPYLVIPMDAVPATLRLRRCIDAVRGWAISRTLRHGGSEGPVLAAMLYGYRKDMRAALRDAFRRVGIGHLLAISGLHVGLIVGLLWWLGGWVGWPLRVRAVCCLLLALVYLGLSGGQVAATRATVMAVIYLGCIAWGRRADMLNSLGAAALLIALANPTAPLDVGFGLSFTAVIFIYLALGRGDREKGLQPGRRMAAPGLRGRIVREIRSLTRLSVATWIGLMPIVALVFNQVNLAGLAVNIVVIPLMVLVLAGGLVLPAVGWIPGAAWAAILPSRALSAIALWTDSLPWSSLSVHAPDAVWMGVFYAFVLLFALGGMVPFAFRRQWGIVMGACALATLAGLGASMADHLPAPPQGRISVLPGGSGVIVAESAGGGIAVLGSLRRGGLNEAMWLQHLRRKGGVAVVAAGRAREADLGGLASHYPVAGFTVLDATDKPQAGSASGWQAVPAAPGIQFASGRDARGRLRWLAARTGGQSACLVFRAGVPEVEELFATVPPGLDARLIVLDGARRASLPEKPESAERVAVRGSAAGGLPDGWFAREEYGVVTMENGIVAYDGKHWRRP